MRTPEASTHSKKTPTPRRQSHLRGSPKKTSTPSWRQRPARQPLTQFFPPTYCTVPARPPFPAVGGIFRHARPRSPRKPAAGAHSRCLSLPKRGGICPARLGSEPTTCGSSAVPPVRFFYYSVGTLCLLLGVYSRGG